MSFTFPAIRGQMGDTQFFQAIIRASDLASVAIPASELVEWGQWTIAERFQRDIGVRRVQEELIPYLVRSKDRFFGSLIVLVFEPAVFDFEPLEVAKAGTPAAYREIAEKMGFLTIDGGKLVALDGQHRLVALREIVAGRADAQGEFSGAVADDELCVVFVRHESLEKTRRIFNKVNRHARPTTPTDNIITSEDDGYAIVARWLVDSAPPLGLSSPLPPLALFDSRGEPLVEWRSAALPTNSGKLTTLSTVYQTVEAILDANGIERFDEKHRVNRPANTELEKAYQWSAQWWSAVLDGMQAYTVARKQPWRIADLRRYGEKWSMLFRPVAQVALFRGLGFAVAHGLPLEESVARANRINWRADAEFWVDTIIRSNGRMVANAQSIRLAGRLIAYMVAADLMSSLAVDALRRDYRQATGRTSSLPKPVK
ncbi:MAG TPA: DNA sulfur modification protein DndB [Ilumatobacteraceae bacterium]|nr:DNA sulfur modification protein DndB [Ilumatobacteraceae bacterium]